MTASMQSVICLMTDRSLPSEKLGTHSISCFMFEVFGAFRWTGKTIQLVFNNNTNACINSARAALAARAKQKPVACPSPARSEVQAGTACGCPAHCITLAGQFHE